MNVAKTTTALSVLMLTACTSVWAQMASRKIANDQLAIESFRGTLTEKHLVLGEPDAVLVKDVLYQKLWKTRVEVKEPAALAGQLFIYDGSQMLMWWPHQGFGMRIRGVPAPSPDELRRFVDGTTEKALRDYAFSRRGQVKVAGQSTDQWAVVPVERAPYRFPYSSYMDRQRSVPLKLDVFDAPDHPWYQMAYRELAFDQPVAADAFAFEFPKKALVLDWDLSAEGVSIETARDHMNFDILEPTALPRGHRVTKVIENRDVVPMVALLMSEGPRWLSLTQLRQVGPPLAPATGKKIRLGEDDGYLNFMGSYSVVTWAKKGTNLTLISNLAYPDVVAVASSVR